MTSALSWGVLFGLILGVGLWSIVSTLPRLSRPSLSMRVAPYVVDISDAARAIVDRRPASPLPVFGLVLAPVVGRLTGVLNAVLGGSNSTLRRLRQAGKLQTIEEFRARQLVWGASGAGIGILVALGLAGYQSIPLVLQFAIVLVFLIGGVLGREYLLQRQAKARVERMAEELPTVLEFLTLSLSAGEGILDAIRRISRISRGELSAELAGVTTEVAVGIPLSDSLVKLAATLELPAFTRSVEQIVGALERGTPIVEVLRAQAQDVRDEGKRELLEIAGRKEVAMLVPLVFLILPTTVAFAIFPGLIVLRMGL
jgi:tight adherence protein C